MNRELKLALIVGFAVVLVVAVLVSDHLSKARQVTLAGVPRTNPALTEQTRFDPPAPSVALIPVQESTQSVAPPSPAPQVEPDGVLFDVQQGLGSRDRLANGSSGNPASPFGTDLIRFDGAPAANSTPKEIPAERIHVVAEGDTLFALAKRYYGDGAKWQTIARANSGRVGDGGALKVGTRLTVPGADGAPVRVATDGTRGAPMAPPIIKTEPTQRENGQYTVKSGDTFGAIAQRMLGSARRADEVARLNPKANPKALQVGMVLRMPKR